MDHRMLGASGVSVSRFALGAMAFGPLGNTDRNECSRMVHRAVEAGINVIDTADFYSRGESESIVGEAIAGRRDDLIVASKCFWPMGDDPNRRGLSRRWILRACEESLRRLGTDWIDVYYLHKPDPTTDIEESLGAMSDLVHQGKVRAVGISTFPAASIVEAHWASERGHLVRPRVEQPPYSILTRHIERDVLPTCQRYGMGVMVWSPLNSGWLSGKYRSGERPPAGSRAERWQSRNATYFDEHQPAAAAKFAAIDRLSAVAMDAGIPLSHLAMAFATEHPAVTSAIIGPRTPEQLEDALAAVDVRLGPDVLDAIDEIVAPGADVDPVGDAGWLPPSLTDPANRRRPRPA